MDIIKRLCAAPYMMVLAEYRSENHLPGPDANAGAIGSLLIGCTSYCTRHTTPVIPVVSKPSCSLFIDTYQSMYVFGSVRVEADGKARTILAAHVHVSVTAAGGHSSTRPPTHSFIFHLFIPAVHE